MFALYFRLRASGRPVAPSQIGTVAAGVGVIAATLGLSESYGAAV